MRVFMAANCSINFMEALGSPHRRSHPLRLHTMPQPARGPPTGPRTGGPWSSGPVLGPRGTVGPPYGPKDRGPLVLRAGGGTVGGYGRGQAGAGSGRPCRLI